MCIFIINYFAKPAQRSHVAYIVSNDEVELFKGHGSSSGVSAVSRHPSA